MKIFAYRGKADRYVNSWRHFIRHIVQVCGVFALLVLAIGCSSVRPYQKEHLADPIMQADQSAEMRELKWLEAREGSTGGAGGAGGGCACR